MSAILTVLLTDPLDLLCLVTFVRYFWCWRPSRAPRRDYDLAYHFNRVKVVGQPVSAGAPGGFLEALQRELDGLREDAKREDARSMTGRYGG